MAVVAKKAKASAYFVGAFNEAQVRAAARLVGHMEMTVTVSFVFLFH
jgi:hypothetical protein